MAYLRRLQHVFNEIFEPQYDFSHSNVFEDNLVDSKWITITEIPVTVKAHDIKAMCMLYGNIQEFYLFLAQGIVFAKYFSFQQATRAVNAMHHQTLHNALIHCASLEEQEVNNRLQILKSMRVDLTTELSLILDAPTVPDSIIERYNNYLQELVQYEEGQAETEEE